MNGKFILLVILCCNFVMLGFYSQSSAQESISLENNPVFKLYSFTDNNNVLETSQPQFTAELDEATTRALTPNSGISPIPGIQTFIDVILLILGILGLLTPLPLLAFISSVGLSMTFVVLVGLPITALYIVSIMEFIRGGTF